MSTAPSGSRPRLLRIFGFLGRTLLVFLVFEGLCSSWSVLAGIAGTRLATDRIHTRYDPELGWVGTPNLSLPNLYGPGVALHTNSQGFRADHDFPVSPGSKRRILCSGDSFTLGFGVGDQEPWCQVLATLDPRLETVNMGQSGYGLDQAYLWYRRDGARLEHQLHLFAFISDDFDRMTSNQFFGFGKPYLEVERGALVTRNVPVPRGSYLLPWVTPNLPRLYELRSIALLGDLFRRVRGAPPPRPALDQTRVAETSFAVFESLAAINRRKGSTLVLVYLPTLADYSPGWMDGARAALGGELQRRGLIFVDLVPEFRALPAAGVDRLYLPGAPGGRHFSAEGHRFVALRLRERLRAIPDAARQIEG